jgi:hypothetical protein
MDTTIYKEGQTVRYKKKNGSIGEGIIYTDQTDASDSMHYVMTSLNGAILFQILKDNIIEMTKDVLPSLNPEPPIYLPFTDFLVNEIPLSHKIKQAIKNKEDQLQAKIYVLDTYVVDSMNLLLTVVNSEVILYEVEIDYFTKHRPIKNQKWDLIEPCINSEVINFDIENLRELATQNNTLSFLDCAINRCKKQIGEVYESLERQYEERQNYFNDKVYTLEEISAA